MWRKLEIAVLLVLIVITAYFYVKERKKAYLMAKEADKNIKQQKEKTEFVLTIKIEGMMCEKCVARVSDALEKFGKVSIDIEGKTATIISDELQDVVEIENTINELGYKFEGLE